MKTYFSQGGLLDKSLPGFEYRALQLRMADAVYDCLRGDSQLLVEAGTGTGKTLAYLIPAVLSGKRVIVSTGTKTLQDQILDYDIPLLKRLFFPQLRAVCLKGRRNYLCLQRFSDFSYQPSLWKPEETRYMRKLQDWVNRTESGDRADIEWLPDSFQIWNELTASSHQCLGAHCHRYDSCFITKARKKASRADLIVVNHHLFFADLAIRSRDGSEILPDYDSVIFDEAHQLEDTIGHYFGLQFSSFELRELTADLLKASTNQFVEKTAAASLRPLCEHLQSLLKPFHASLKPAAGGPANRLPFDPEDLRDSFRDVVDQCQLALNQLCGVLTPLADESPYFETGIRRAQELQENLDTIVAKEDRDLIYWYELYRTRQDFVLFGTPIDAAPIFQRLLLDKTASVVLTSATLSAPEKGRASFTFTKERLGFGDEVEELLLPSPFDYDKQALLYVPQDFPEPRQPQFRHRLIDLSKTIIDRSGGRALFLFTSYRNMQEVHAGLSEQLDYPVLMQGQKPKRALLSEFKERVESVLLATHSFWEGVDIPGESLTCLLIDKLPFEVPSDPIVAARCDALNLQEKSSFFHYQVPRAAIHLKQGVGRLIRSTSDHGVIVVFDVRLFTKSYGRLFRESLTPLPITRNSRQLSTFMDNLPSRSGLVGHGPPPTPPSISRPEPAP